MTLVSAPNRPRTLAALTSATAALALVAACSTGSSDEAATVPATSDGSPETSSISVGVLAFADLAPFYIAVEDGMFEEEGLTVTVNDTVSGAAQIPSLVSGEIQINYGSYVSLFQAIDEGLPLMVIRENNRPGPQGIFVKGDSPISEPADLAGKTIAVNSHGSIQDLTSKAVLDFHGVDVETLTFVEMSPADMVSAMEIGNVDAAWLVEPFVTTATNDGYRKIVSAWEGPTADIPVAGWSATEQFVQDNPNTIAAFNRVMDEAMALAAENPERMGEIIPTYTEIPPDVAAQIAQNSIYDIAVESDLSNLDKVSDLMEKWNLIEKPIDMDKVALTSQ